MSLSVPSSSSVGVHNSHWGSSGTSITSNAHKDIVVPMEQNPAQISLKATQFIKGIEKKAFEPSTTTHLQALKEVIWLVSKEGVTPIQDALMKKSGYFTRFFLNEDWENWTHYRTPLGRVVNMLCDYITTSTRLDHCVSRLDKKLLEVANQDAALVLKSLKVEKTSNKQGKLPALFGSPVFPPTVDPTTTLNGTNGFTLNGVMAGEGSGIASNAGDVNGDGISDLIIGAPGFTDVQTYAGKSYIVFGSSKRWNELIELSSLNGTNGFVLNGESPGDGCGISISSAGDVNGDGISDFIIGANGARAYAGKTYVVFGSKKGWSSPIELSSLNGANGFILNGEAASDNSGFSVSGAGDINDDGISDIVIGASNASPSSDRDGAGKSYVIFGKRSAWSSPIELSSLNGMNGFILNGEARADRSGTVSNAGDINGDGISDIVIGASNASPSSDRGEAGKSYVIFGKRSGWSSPFELSSLNGVNGFILNGEAMGDDIGYSVSGASDINDDGISDIVMGAPFASPSGDKIRAGKTYVLFGKKEIWNSPFGAFNPQRHQWFYLKWGDGK